MSEIYTLEKIREVLNDGFPNCAREELERWMNENGITAEAAQLAEDIEISINDNQVDWDKFITRIDNIF